MAIKEWKFSLDSNDLEKAYHEVKMEFLAWAYRECRYNQSKLALEIGISRGTIRKQLAEMDEYLKEKI